MLTCFLLWKQLKFCFFELSQQPNGTFETRSFHFHACFPFWRLWYRALYLYYTKENLVKRRQIFQPLGRELKKEIKKLESEWNKNAILFQKGGYGGATLLEKSHMANFWETNTFCVGSFSAIPSSTSSHWHWLCNLQLFLQFIIVSWLRVSIAFIF